MFSAAPAQAGPEVTHPIWTRAVFPTAPLRKQRGGGYATCPAVGVPSHSNAQATSGGYATQPGAAASIHRFQSGLISYGVL